MKYGGRFVNLKNKHFPIRTCASCEYTYWGGWKAKKSCPKCDFAHYGALFVYENIFCVFFQLITKWKYRRKKDVS